MFAKNKKLWAALALLVIAGSCGLRWWSTRSRNPPFNPIPARGVGAVAARETAKRLDNRGRVVVWIYKATPATRQLTKSTLDGFRKSLAAHRELVLAGVEQVEPPTGFGTIPNVELTGLSAEQFTALLDKSREADAVVSFIAPPLLTREAIARLPQPRPQLIVAALFSPPAPQLVEDGLIQVAIVPKRDAQQTGTFPNTPDEWMDRHYEVRIATPR